MKHDIQDEFEGHYQAWKRYIALPSVSESSSNAPYVQNVHYEKIVELGSPALPYLVEKMQSDPDAHFLIHAMERITGKTFTSLEREQGEKEYGAPLGNQGIARMWIAWWKTEGRKGR